MWICYAKGPCLQHCVAVLLHIIDGTPRSRRLQQLLVAVGRGAWIRGIRSSGGVSLGLIGGETVSGGASVMLSKVLPEHRVHGRFPHELHIFEHSTLTPDSENALTNWELLSSRAICSRAAACHRPVRARPTAEPRHFSHIAWPFGPCQLPTPSGLSQNCQKNATIIFLTTLALPGKMDPMNESGNRFSFTRAASSTSGRAKNQIPFSST